MHERTKAEATAKAKALLKRMTTKGWKIRVHENMGWHYNLINGPVNLYEYVLEIGKPHYSCLIGTENGGCGVGLALWTEEKAFKHPSSKDPNKCVARAVSFAHSVIVNYFNLLKPAFLAIGLKPDSIS